MKPSRHSPDWDGLKSKKQKENTRAEKKCRRQRIIFENPIIENRIQKKNKNSDGKENKLFFKKQTARPCDSGQIQKAQKG